MAQVQAKVNQLTSQYDKVTQQLDQVGEQLSAAQTRLAQVRADLNHANAKFQAARTTVAQFAAATFEDTDATSIAGVLTSADPSVVLQQGSLLLELSGSRNAETAQLLTDASQLAGVEQELQRTEDGIAALKTQLADHKNSLGKLIATEQATLDSLTVPQQQTVKSNSIGANGSTVHVTYTGPTSTQADKAVAFAYAQLGCPYVYGGTGPCQMGFDCSGLAQAAWAAAGVAIPRDSYEQWAELPHVPLSATRAWRPAALQRRGPRRHLRGRRLHHRRAGNRHGRGADPDEHALVRRQPRRSGAPRSARPRHRAADAGAGAER